MNQIEYLQAGRRAEKRYISTHNLSDAQREARIRELDRERTKAIRASDYKTADVTQGRISVLRPERSLMVPPEPKRVKQTKKGGINMPNISFITNPHPVVAGMVCATVCILAGLRFEVTILATGAVCRLVSQRRGENMWKQVCYGVGPAIPTLLGSWWLFAAALAFHVFIWKEDADKDGEDGEDSDEDSDKDSGGHRKSLPRKL